MPLLGGQGLFNPPLWDLKELGVGWGWGGSMYQVKKNKAAIA